MFSRNFALPDCDIVLPDSFQELLEKLSNNCIYRYQYSAMDLESFDLSNGITERLRRNILNQFYCAGFVIIRIPESIQGSEAVDWIKNEFHLGNPFIPNYFGDYHNLPIKTEKGINRISATNKKTKHNAFTDKNEQRLHVDGTVEPFLVKTSVLYCEETALSGGESQIFNAVAAFTSYAASSKDEALALLHPQGLTRAHSDKLDQPSISSVFRFYEGEIDNRFSIDNTSYWENGFQSVPNLKTAFDAMIEYSSNKGFYLEFALKKNQILMIANTKLSHGRRGYIDGKHPRLMYRGLYLELPR
jgi:alpha-ketoglutarate-dependent taurine dioxygenase